MEVVTFDDLIKIAVVIMGIWGFCKVVTEIVKAITARHDREQKWDATAEDIRKERQDDMEQYNKKLSDISLIFHTVDHSISSLFVFLPLALHNRLVFFESFQYLYPKRTHDHEG